MSLGLTVDAKQKMVGFSSWIFLECILDDIRMGNHGMVVELSQELAKIFGHEEVLRNGK